MYFPWFVFLVATLLDCHLSYKPLGQATPLDTSTMCSHAVLHRCTLLNSLLCHAQSPRIRPLLWMTLLLMGLRQIFLLQLRCNPVLLWFLLHNFYHCQHLSRLSHLLTRHHSTSLPYPLTFVCLRIRSTFLLVFWSLLTLPLHVTWHRCSFPQSLATRSSNSFIIPIPLFWLFVRVTLQTIQTLRHIGLRRKFIGLWVVKSFGITSTSYRSVGMVYGSTAANFPCFLVPLLPSLRQNVVNNLTAPVASILILFMWISLLVTVLPFVVFDMPLFWWTGPPGTMDIGLQMLSSDCILVALCLFQASAGSLAQCFYCDCDTKLFGTAISEYLVDNDSKLLPPWQSVSRPMYSSNPTGNMACAYLTEKQMPCPFWLYAVTHAARMMNAIPCQIHGHLASPFLLVHSIGHGKRTWVPIFSLSLCYFHHEKDGDKKHSKN